MSEPGLPDELAEALGQDRAAADAFTLITAGERQQHAQWVASCRTAETRKARVRDVVRIAKWQADRRRRDLKRLGPSPFGESS